MSLDNVLLVASIARDNPAQLRHRQRAADGACVLLGGATAGIIKGRGSLQDIDQIALVLIVAIPLMLRNRRRRRIGRFQCARSCRRS